MGNREKQGKLEVQGADGKREPKLGSGTRESRYKAAGHKVQGRSKIRITGSSKIRQAKAKH